MPNPVPPADQPLPQTYERRAYVRYSRTLDTFWQCLGLAPAELTSGQVFDLSATGVGLLLEQEFRIGITLVIRLPTSTRGWSSHLVRVKNCQKMEDGRYQVGCAFVKPLSATQLQGHLD